jgi:hypothetical protein
MHIHDDSTLFSLMTGAATQAIARSLWRRSRHGVSEHDVRWARRDRGDERATLPGVLLREKQIDVRTISR